MTKIPTRRLRSVKADEYARDDTSGSYAGAPDCGGRRDRGDRGGRWRKGLEGSPAMRDVEFFEKRRRTRCLDMHPGCCLVLMFFCETSRNWHSVKTGGVTV